MPVESLPTPNAPAAIGPYSPAVRAGAWVIVSAQIGIDPATGRLAGDDTHTQAAQVLANIRGVLADCGLGLDDVAKTTIAVTDMGDFPTVNEVYADAFGEHRPARATLGVAALPMGALVLIEAWAYAPVEKGS